YPPSFNAAAARGTIVHAGLNRIIRALVLSGCTDLSDPNAFAILKQLGGYSAILSDEFLHWMSRCDSNPRLEREEDVIQHRLESLLPEMRIATQKLLRGTCLVHHAMHKKGHGPVAAGGLQEGVYFEVDLRHPTLRWKGFADLIEITAAGDVAITDFKTGDWKQVDEYQLQIYALLWARDTVRNPTGKLATKL